MTPLECLLVAFLVAGIAWLAACLAGLAHRRALDFGLLAQAVQQLSLGRDAYVRDLVRDDMRWTARMIARAAEDAAGKSAEVLRALPDFFAADLARLRKRIDGLRRIGIFGTATGILAALARLKGAPPADEAASGAGFLGISDPLDPVVVGLSAMVVLLIVCSPLKNMATFIALRARQEIGAMLARARVPAAGRPWAIDVRRLEGVSKAD